MRALFVLVAATTPALADRGELRLSMFELADGRYLEAALCGSTGLRYGCIGFAAGTQDGRVLGVEAVELGIRTGPSRHLQVSAGVGASVLSLVVDGIACMGGTVTPPMTMMQPAAEACDDIVLPISAYATTSLHVTVHRVVLAGTLRVQDAVRSTVLGLDGGRGVSAAVGIGVSW